MRTYFKRLLLGYCKCNGLNKAEDENKAQVMTKAFASRVWKCIVYYCGNGAFPDVSLLDRQNVFDGIRLDASNFLENDGNGDCGVISVLQGNALIDGSEEDKAPNRQWTADEIKNSRTGAAGKVGAVKREERKGKNGDTFKFLPEDAAKWDTYTQRINDLESKGSAITDKETKSLKLAKSRRDDLEINFTTVAAGKRIAAMRANNLYEKKPSSR